MWKPCCRLAGSVLPEAKPVLISKQSESDISLVMGEPPGGSSCAQPYFVFKRLTIALGCNPLGIRHESATSPS